ncbi:MAG: glycosyltransferase family 87 protein, partial [Chloroflexota bacterium]
DGEPLYQDFLQFPHVITPYPPVQPVVSGLLSRLLGLSVLETAGLARGLTFAASLSAMLLIGLITRQCGAGKLAALAGASLFLPLPFLDEWGFAARPDLPAVALSLLALLLLVAQPQRAWLAASVAVLAFFTKQTAVALPVAAVLWLLLNKRWRTALVFAGSWAALTGATLLALELVTGRTYLLNTLFAHLATPKNGFDLAMRDFMTLPEDAWPALTLALAAGPLLVRDRRPLLPLIYLGVSTTLALVSLRNTGGDVNYLIEPAAAASVPAALAISWLWQRHGPLRLARIAGSVALAGAVVYWGLDTWDYWRLDGGVNPGPMALDEIAAADSVLSEEPLGVLLAGRPLLVSDTFHLSMLTTSGFFDPLELERRIKRSEFDLIITRSDIRSARWWKRQLLLPEGVRLAIKDVYVPDGRVGIYWLYRPEDRRGSRR